MQKVSKTSILLLTKLEEAKKLQYFLRFIKHLQISTIVYWLQWNAIDNRSNGVIMISVGEIIDDLKDANIGEPVSLTGDYEIGRTTSGSIILGKLISLTLTDADDGERLATVQIGGICSLSTSTTYPNVGDRIVGGTAGTVRQAPALAGNDPAGGNVARGTVVAVNGTSDCTVILN